MKQLLSMSKQRKQKDDKKSIKQILKAEPVEQQHNFIYQQSQSEMAEMEGPTEQQVRAYAQILGIRLPEEEDLLYLARQCLNQQTPPDWHCQEDQQGEIIYVNHKTGKVSLQHPCDQIYRQKVISERKKKVNNIKKGMTKINLPKSKTTFLQNIFKAKDQPQKIIPQIKRSNQNLQKAKQLQKMIKQNIKQQKNDPQLYDDQYQPINPIKSHSKPFNFKKQHKQQNKDPQIHNVVSQKKQQSDKIQQIDKPKQFKKIKNAQLIQKKKKQIAQRLQKRYQQMNNELDKKYVAKLKQMQKQQYDLKQKQLQELEQKLWKNKIERKKKQIEMSLMLQHKVQLDKIKLQAEREHRKDILSLSAKYQIEQLFTEMAQCRKFINRQKLQTQKINYIGQIQQNIRIINQIEIDKTVSQIQKQLRALMYKKITQFMDKYNKQDINWEQQNQIAVQFSQAIQNTIQKHNATENKYMENQIVKKSQNRMTQANTKQNQRQNQTILSELQVLKKKLRELQDENNTQRSNLSDKQTKLFDLLQNRVGPSSARSFNNN